MRAWKRFKCWCWHSHQWKWMGPAHRRHAHDHVKRHIYSCNRCAQTWYLVEWATGPQPRIKHAR
jgi:hypothetical protein